MSSDEDKPLSFEELTGTASQEEWNETTLDSEYARKLPLTNSIKDISLKRIAKQHTHGFYLITTAALSNTKSTYVSVRTKAIKLMTLCKVSNRKG